MDTTQSSNWWIPSGKTLLMFGAGVFAFGGVLYYFNTKTIVTKRKKTPTVYSKPSHNDYKNILKDLHSPVPDKQIEALNSIYLMSRHAETHDALRLNGGLSRILELFAEHKKEPALIQSLIRVITNMATNEKNRLIIGESSCITDMLYYLDNTIDDVITGDILRGLMNLSVAEANEDLIRHAGGLHRLIQIFKDETTNETNLLQTCRVLVNLACNPTNRQAMIEENLHIDVVQGMFKHKEDKMFGIRIFRLAGSLAFDAPCDVYKHIATSEVATLFAEILQREMNAQNELGTKPAEDLAAIEGFKNSVSLCEVILFALVKICSDEKKEEASEEHLQAMKEFKQAFAEANGIPCVMQLLTHADRHAKTSALYCLVHLSKNSTPVKQAMLLHKEGIEELRRLSEAREASTARVTSELLLALDSL